MTNSKSTKRALLTSVLALLMCVAMLIGATFAWFTDTASTGVNKIQAGNLDVKLEYATAWNDDGSVKTWADAEGKTLTFKTKAIEPPTKSSGSRVVHTSCPSCALSTTVTWR